MKRLLMLAAAAVTACCVFLTPKSAQAYEWKNGNEVWDFNVYEDDDGDLEATITGYSQVDDKGDWKELPDNLSVSIPATVPVNWTNEYGVTEKVYDSDGNWISNKYVTTRGPDVKAVDVTVTGVDMFWSQQKLVSATFPASVEWISGFTRCTNLVSVSVADDTEFRGGAFIGSPWLKNQGDFVVRDGVLVAYQGKETNVTVPDGIEMIGDNAFDSYYNKDMTNLTSVILPVSVEEIGDEAFYGCEKLASINIPASVTIIDSYAFYGCESLATVTLPTRLRHLGGGAFCECSALSSLAVPENVKRIEYDTFNYCTNLSTVTLPTSLETIEDFAFNGTALTSIAIPDSVESIGYGAFESCWNLTSVALPASLKTLEGEAFYYCTNLTTVTGGASVKDLGYDTFYDTALYNNVKDGIVQAGTLVVGYKGTLPAALQIPDGVTYVAPYVFAYNTDLTSVALPASVNTLGYEAFYGCANLATVTGGEGVTRILGDSAFYGTKYWETFWNERGTNSVPFAFVRLGGVILGYKGVCPAEVVIPDDATQVFNSLFHYYDYATPTNITSVTIGAGVKRIGDSAFYGLENLATVTGGGAIETIAEEAFAECPRLTDVSLAGPLTSLDSVFCYDTNTLNVAFTVTEPEDEDDRFILSNYNFYGCDGLASVKVTRAGYTLAGWETWSNGPLMEEFADELITYKTRRFVRNGKGEMSYTDTLRLQPLWKRALRTPETDAPFNPDVKSEYVGWLTDADGNLIGTITVKVSKKDSKGVSKATATVQMIGQRKTTLKGTFDASGNGTDGLAGLKLGANALGGQLTVNGAVGEVAGARDVNKTSKDPDQDVFKTLKNKVWTMALATKDADSDFANGYIGLSVKMGTKGKATVKGVMPNGAKVSVTAQTVVGGDSCCIPVVYSKAKDSFGFLVWIDRDGKALDVDSFSEWKCTAKDASFTAKLKKVDFDEMAALEGQLPFVIERSELPSALTGVQYNYLPTGEGETVTLSAKKWTVAKPAAVKYKKGVGFDQAAFDKGVAQGKTNLSGLKLTYASREGTFKGSFTVYTITDKDTLKKVTATVEGAVVGNAGYGSALIKKVGSMPVVIGTSEEDED